MKRQFDTEMTIIVLAVGVVYLGYLQIIDWMPELGGYHSILALYMLALCWAVGLKIRRANRQRSVRHDLSRHSL